MSRFQRVTLRKVNLSQDLLQHLRYTYAGLSFTLARTWWYLYARFGERADLGSPFTCLVSLCAILVTKRGY